MKILIYGAGVIGSIYAAKIHEAGIDTILLARGKRYENLKENGVIIRDVLSNKKTIRKVPLTQALNADDFYDLIIVTVRLDQLKSIIPVLQRNSRCTNILFMLNNPDNVTILTEELPGKNILLGFPGAGGTYHNNQIDYVQIKQQKTTLGKSADHNSELLQRIATILKQVGFPVEISSNMEAWLKIHAVFMACVAGSIIKENGDSIQLGKNKKSVRTMVKSIHEGFMACQSLGLPIRPANLKMIFMTMPQWFSVWYWQRAMQGQTGTLAMAPHINTAKGEMQLLAKKVLDLVHVSFVDTPTLDGLLGAFIQPDN